MGIRRGSYTFSTSSIIEGSTSSSSNIGPIADSTADCGSTKPPSPTITLPADVPAIEAPGARGYEGISEVVTRSDLVSGFNVSPGSFACGFVETMDDSRWSLASEV